MKGPGEAGDTGVGVRAKRFGDGAPGTRTTGGGGCGVGTQAATESTAATSISWWAKSEGAGGVSWLRLAKEVQGWTM
jgi:hypothetical protein